jgi:glycosyltransferase involved in cell wall biosynthesis
MAHAFNHWNRSCGEAYFISFTPKSTFISGGNRPLILELVDSSANENVYSEYVNSSFELGSIAYRAYRYSQLIKKWVPPGTTLVPSDDEACWMAAVSVGSVYNVVGVLHSDESAYYRLAEKYNAHVNSFISVSSRIKNKLSSQFPFIVNIEVIPCGIPVGAFNTKTRKRNKIVWVGRLERYQKRAQDIPAIWEGVRNHCKDASIQAVGNGDFSSKLDQYIQQLDEPDRFVASGWVSPSEVRGILAESKIFLQTSDFEGMSVALMEALASGCMVVSTKVSGVEDVANTDEAKGVVFLYEAGDVGEASKLILKALKSYDEQTERKSRQLANDLFDIRRTNDSIVNLMKNMRPIESKNYTLSGVRIFLSPLLAFMRWLKWKLLSLGFD